MTRFIVVPLLVVAVLFGLVGPNPIIAVGLALVTVLPALMSFRFTASKAAQIVIGVALFGGTITVMVTLLATNYAAPETLRPPWAAFAAASLLVAATRNYFVKPIGEDSGTIGIGFCALTGCGGAKTDFIYPVFVLLFLLAAAHARRIADTGHAPREALLSRRNLVRVGAMLGIAAVVATPFIVSLPPLHDWAVRKIMQRLSTRSGFSERLWVGSLRGMLLSDRKVLRVHGEDVDYLRGIVYANYLGGRWGRSVADAPSPESAVEELEKTPGEPGDVVEIRFVDAEPKRYFVPLEMGEIAVSSGIALVDRHGVVGPVAAEPAYRVQYRRSGKRAFPLAPPDAADTELPRVVRRLRGVANDWTSGTTTAKEAADAISERLQNGDFRYSLDYELDARRDPLVEFLLHKREGHCELFASSMAVLLRFRGIPTRLVAGYRVTEYNPVGDYYIVRERNAHAWVEVYLPERGWTTYDPTPAAELDMRSSKSTSWLGGVADSFGSGWRSFLSWLDKRTWAEVLGGPAVVIVVPLVIRMIVRRRRKRREDGEADEASSLACFDELTAALAGVGVERRASETIEQLALRAETTGSRPLADGSELLRRYAALRYGGIGDLSELEKDIRAFCSLVTAAPEEG